MFVEWVKRQHLSTVHSSYSERCGETWSGKRGAWGDKVVLRGKSEGRVSEKWHWNTNVTTDGELTRQIVQAGKHAWRAPAYSESKEDSGWRRKERRPDPKSLECSGGGSTPSPLPRTCLSTDSAPKKAHHRHQWLHSEDIKRPHLMVSSASPGATQECCAQNKPGFINSVWGAFYNSGDGFPPTRSQERTLARANEMEGTYDPVQKRLWMFTENKQKRTKGAKRKERTIINQVRQWQSGPGW